MNSKPGSVAVSADNKRILIAVADLGHSACIDLSTPAGAVVRRTIPMWFSRPIYFGLMFLGVMLIIFLVRDSDRTQPRDLIESVAR